MPKKSSKKEFINKAVLVHDTNYDYSLVEYTDSTRKIKIICPTHGEFLQRPVEHLRGKGCMKCFGNKRFDPNYFIQKANKVHNNKYDYSLVECKNNLTKITIICPFHGDFSQIPNNHLQGSGCKKCMIDNMSGKNNSSWNPNRENVEINKKINTLSKSLIRTCLKLTNQKKTTKTEQLLGYTRTQLLEHLQKDPNFEYWKNDSKNWHIDHYWPKKAFIEHGIYDLDIINSLDNLRIISSEENLKKNDEYNKNKFIKYINGINI